MWFQNPDPYSEYGSGSSMLLNTKPVWSTTLTKIHRVCFVNKMLKLYVAVDMDRLLPVPVLTFFVCRRTEFGKTCGCSGRADRSRSRRRRWVETSVVEPIRVYLFLRLWLLLRCTNKKLKKNDLKKY